MDDAGTVPQAADGSQRAHGMAEEEGGTYPGQLQRTPLQVITVYCGSFFPSSKHHGRLAAHGSRHYRQFQGAASTPRPGQAAQEGQEQPDLKVTLLMVVQFTCRACWGVPASY